MYEKNQHDQPLSRKLRLMMQAIKEGDQLPTKYDDSRFKEPNPFNTLNFLIDDGWHPIQTYGQDGYLGEKLWLETQLDDKVSGYYWCDITSEWLFEKIDDAVKFVRWKNGI
jgi:hypothetical protein